MRMIATVLSLAIAITPAGATGPIRVRVKIGPSAPAGAGATAASGAGLKPVALGNLSLTGSPALGVRGAVTATSLKSPSPVASPALAAPLPQKWRGEGTAAPTAVSPSPIATPTGKSPIPQGGRERSPAGELRDAPSPSPIPSPPGRSPLPQRGRGHGTTLESLSETGKRIAGGDGRAAVDALYHERGGESDGADFTPALMRRGGNGLTPSDPDDYRVRRRYEEHKSGPEPARAPDSGPSAELGIRWPAENVSIPGPGRDERTARQYVGGSGRVFKVESTAGPLALKASDKPGSRFSREAALLRHLTPLLARPEVAARLPKGFGVIRFAGHFLVDGASVDGGQPDSLLGRMLAWVRSKETPARREVLAMPWVEGRSLALFLEDRAAGEVADAEWARFMAVYPDFARGVRLLAELGLNNMDIQPQNILYDAAAGKLIMTDLGIAEWVSGPQLEDALMRLPARWDSHDRQDVRFLLRRLKLKRPEAVFRIIEKYYPQERVPAKTRFLLEELLAG